MTTLQRTLGTAKQTINAWIDDNCMSRSAALAFYTVFSIAPIFVIASAVASLFFQKQEVVDALLDQTRRMVGTDGAAFVAKLLDASAHEQSRGLASVIAIITVLIGATTAFAELKDSLDAIWHAPKQEHGSGVKALLRARLLSFALVLALALMLVASLVANASLDAFSDVIGATILTRVVTTLVSVLGVAVLFTTIFKLLPATRPTWRVAIRGSVLTTILFVVGRALVGLYLGHTATASSFGAAGALAALLLWVYYSALIFFLGAEYTRVLSTNAAKRTFVGERIVDSPPSRHQPIRSHAPAHR